jgi:two-component system, OmpR family, sensor histidine kinase TctE
LTRRLLPTGSLRLNLLVWLVVPGLLILAVGAWLSYGSAMRQATLVMDRQLTASARMMAEAIGFADGRLDVVTPPAALELFASDSHDEVAYAVEGPGGELLAGYPGFDAPGGRRSDAQDQHFDTAFRTEAMRAAVFRQPVVTPTGTVFATVIVGETLKARDLLVQTLWLRGFVEQAALVVAGALFIWVGINRELRPLLRLRQAVLDRPADRFEPFEAASVQTEVRPLVLALNSHMERLRAQLERQRRFLDSAAHQLRTPLAIMKTQVGYARRIVEPAEVNLALGEVDGSLTAMARLTNQLLTLGGVEHERGLVRAEVIDLEATARQAIMDNSRRALDAGIELAFDSDGRSYIEGTEVLVREMISNLIDNAIQHAGAGATASFAVRRGVNDVLLRSEDNGRGIDPEDRAGLLERFHRGRNARPGGSGLGLSIVAEIAEALGGTVELPLPRGGRGFCVEVKLPAADSVGAARTALAGDG